jgi:NADH-quinone oxidoreductase subunit M
VKERYHTLEIRRLSGMLLQMPRLGWILGFCAMASLGLPGLAGFWGEFPALLAAYQPAPGLNVGLFRGYMVVGAIGTVFAAGYLLWMLQRAAFGEVKDELAHAHVSDMHWPEYLAWTPLLLAIVALGVYPQLLFGITDEAVRHAVVALGR